MGSFSLVQLAPHPAPVTFIVQSLGYFAQPLEKV